MRAHHPHVREEQSKLREGWGLPRATHPHVAEQLECKFLEQRGLNFIINLSLNEFFEHLLYARVLWRQP